MKRLLIFVMAVIAALSSYDYARSPDHLGMAVAAGVVVTIWLTAKAID
ncbi:hypothetical protein [Nocardia veterana]|uniref:Uncharacterized protein n=1 Tax=Nocardia veterana TaxID=132249 RepID=A0A7X6RG87_9NOCA|nr:hypothetical protein [Nocardia veterana]NKY84229.1 hypothetical protein [Nocardia veterana]